MKINTYRGWLLLIAIFFMFEKALPQTAPFSKLDDFDQVFETISKSKLFEPKGEFETTEQYKKRLDSTNRISAGGKIVSESYFFKGNPRLQYDADREIMQADISLESNKDICPEQNELSLNSTVSYSTATLISQNLRLQNAPYNLEFLNRNKTDRLQFKVPLKAAEFVKKNSSVVVEVSLQFPYFSNSKYGDNKATIIQKSLVGILKRVWIIDNISKEIYLNYDFPEDEKRIDISNYQERVKVSESLVNNTFQKIKNSREHKPVSGESSTEFNNRIALLYKDDIKVIKNLEVDEYSGFLGKDLPNFPFPSNPMSERGFLRSLKFGKYTLKLFNRYSICIPLDSISSNNSLPIELGLIVSGYPLEIGDKTISFFAKKVQIFDKKTGQIYNR